MELNWERKLQNYFENCPNSVHNTLCGIPALGFHATLLCILIYHCIVGLQSPEPPPKDNPIKKMKHVFAPNGFVLQQVCFHVVNMFVHLNHPF